MTRFLLVASVNGQNIEGQILWTIPDHNSSVWAYIGTPIAALAGCLECRCGHLVSRIVLWLQRVGSWLGVSVPNGRWRQTITTKSKYSHSPANLRFQEARGCLWSVGLVLNSYKPYRRALQSWHIVRLWRINAPAPPLQAIKQDGLDPALN